MMPPEQWKVYWAFREHFLDDPHMRISTVLIERASLPWDDGTEEKTYFIKVYFETYFLGEWIPFSYGISWYDVNTVLPHHVDLVAEMVYRKKHEIYRDKKLN
jgi:hypothetical protein